MASLLGLAVGAGCSSHKSMYESSAVVRPRNRASTPEPEDVVMTIYCVMLEF